ncbi:MAG TPA: ATP-binding protein, partial [Vicinamibacteria bacterium]|nr:ATP-binding protein [Vicinamibacteria bacterium]
MSSPAPAVPSPAKIAAALGKRVLGQVDAVREVSVALAKKLAGLRVGNILLVGSSGSGKTTLMRAVEDLLAADPALALRSTVVRIHANVIGEEAQQGTASERVMH